MGGYCPKIRVSGQGRFGMKNKSDDRSTWAIGGGLLTGMGVGFLFIQESPLAFVACLFMGLGLGLVITPLISSLRRSDD